MQKIDIDHPDALKSAIDVLNTGGVVMHPTETCYGLAVDIFNKDALAKLYRIKAMDLNKPVSILVDGLGMALEYGIFPQKALELARDYWPGALSIVVPRKRDLPEFLNPGNDFVSFRHSSLSFCTEMVKALGRPISTTSANKSGEKESYKPFKLKGVDLLIDGGEILKTRPSTIVKVEGDLVTILRQGDVILSE